MIQHLGAKTSEDVGRFYDAKYRQSGLEAFSNPDRSEILFLLKHFSAPGFRGRLLDVGCGTGQTLEYMRAHAASIAGIDVSQEAVRLAEQRLGDAVAVFQADMESVGLRFPAHFDWITCLGAIEHAMDPRRALDSMLVALAPRGVLVVTVPIEFFDCLSALRSEMNQSTNERFAGISEWLDYFGGREHAFKVIGDGEQKDLAIVFNTED